MMSLLLPAGVSRPQSRALTSASSGVRPKPKQVQKVGIAKVGRPDHGPRPFSSAGPAQGFDAGAQVLKLDQSRGRQRIATSVLQEEEIPSQSRRR